MKKLLVVLCFAISLQANAQFLKDFFKYSTVYLAGNVENSYQSERKNYFVEPPTWVGEDQFGRVVDITEYYPTDYRVSIGIRKLARFDYESKQGNFYDGTESNIAMTSPTSAVTGIEYLFQYEKERERGEESINSRYFLKHTGKYHIVKLEQRKESNAGLDYLSGEIRGRIPIGKLSVSAGVIYRTHQLAYGYNPFELWLNEVNEWNQPANPWYSLGYQFGYTDEFAVTRSDNGVMLGQGWIWRNAVGEIVAYSDEDFRKTVFEELIYDYNNTRWDELDAFGVVSPVVGADFYHYSSSFWIHAWGSYFLPYHKYVQGEEDFSYGHRNNWGKGGLKDKEFEQWEDYQVGVIMGLKLGNKFGIFIEGEYTKFWDTKIYNSSVGINYTFK